MRLYARRVAARTQTRIDDVLIGAARGPLVTFVTLLGLKAGSRLFSDGSGPRDFFGKLASVGFIMSTSWFAVRLWRAFVDLVLIPFTRKSRTDLDEQLIPVASRAISGAILIFTGILVVSELGYDVVSLLTGLGLGGLALALAAKDTLSPMVGGVAIFITKPFLVRHLVKLEGSEGEVLEIGLRATTVRTPGGATLIIPNDKIINSVIMNYTKGTLSRMYMEVGVSYDLSSDGLEKACALVKEAVADAGAQKGDCVVREFAASSINLGVTYWIEDLSQAALTRHKLIVAVKRRFDEAGIDIPFPCQTVYEHKMEPVKPAAGPHVVARS
jgi:MscS family membrane protein